MFRRIGIICASEKEAAPFYSYLETVSITVKAMLKTQEGTLRGMEADIVSSGVCKVNAAIAKDVTLALL